MCMGVARTQNPFSFKSVRLPFYYLLAEDKKTRLRESHPNYQLESARLKQKKINFQLQQWQRALIKKVSKT